MGPEFVALVARVAGGESVEVRGECARLGVSTKTFYKYLKRFRVEGVAGFYPRSRRPATSPTRLDAALEDLVVRARKELGDQGWDAGAEQIGFWLAAHRGLLEVAEGGALPSRSTINRVLERRGQIIKVPQRRPRRSRHRFEADQPNTMWQMDGFQTTLADGRVVVVLHITDDCSRLDLALRAVSSENAADVWAAVLWASSRYGLPAQFLTDNGTAFSGRRRGWISALEENLTVLGVKVITSSVRHPQTCGKNERAHATVLRWLTARAASESLEDLQNLLDIYREHHNEHRRRTHLDGLTPAERYQLGPTDGPGTTPATWPVQIQQATVSASGCIGIDHHLLGIGRRHAGTKVTYVRQHRQIAVFTGNHLIAEFTLNGRRRYQPRNPVSSPKS